MPLFDSYLLQLYSNKRAGYHYTRIGRWNGCSTGFILRIQQHGVNPGIFCKWEYHFG